MLPITAYADQHGVITQHPRWGADAGDSAHRHGVLALYNDVWIVGDKFALEYFFNEDGKLIRHPDGAQAWTRELDRGSRDQYTPWLAALAIKKARLKSKPLLKKIAKHILANYGRFHNYRKNGQLDAPLKSPDFAGPKIWSVLLRGLFPEALYPVIYPIISILDLEFLLGSLVWNNFREGDSDIINHLCLLKASNEVMPTFVSKLALKILDKPMAIRKLKHYWDFPGHSPEPEKDPNYLGHIMITWLEKL